MKIIFLSSSLYCCPELCPVSNGVPCSAFPCVCLEAMPHLSQTEVLMARFPSSVLGPLTAFDMSAYGNFMLSVAQGKSLGLFALALSRPTARSVAAPLQSVERPPLLVPPRPGHCLTGLMLWYSNCSPHFYPCEFIKVNQMLSFFCSGSSRAFSFHSEM